MPFWRWKRRSTSRNAVCSEPSHVASTLDEGLTTTPTAPRLGGPTRYGVKTEIRTKTVIATIARYSTAPTTRRDREPVTSHDPGCRPSRALASAATAPIVSGGPPAQQVSDKSP